MTHAVIVYLGPKGPKVIEYQVNQEFVTPAGVTKKAKLPYVWSDAEVLGGRDDDDRKNGGMRAKLHLMHNALQSYPDWPEPWTDPDTDLMHTFEGVFGGEATWQCPGAPLCNLPDDVARRKPGHYVWEREES